MSPTGPTDRIRRLLGRDGRRGSHEGPDGGDADGDGDASDPEPTLRQSGDASGNERATDVRVRDVSVSLGGTPVLRDVSLSVPSGTLLGLVGPNGAGKTTLLRTLNGTLVPDAGRVLVGGRSVATMNARAVGRRVATVPQDTSVSFDFTVRQVVEMGRYPHRPRFGADPDPGAVDRAMERAGVTDLADRSVESVSGGERQRVVLARALAQDAPVLALDEPTASLDVDGQVDVLGLVADLVANGRTAAAAVHDLDLAARYCDALALLSGGELLATGPPRAVLTEPRVAAAFGADAVVADDPVTGTPRVTAFDDHGDPAPGSGSSSDSDAGRGRDADDGDRS